MKHIVKHCKPIFYDLGPSLFAQAVLHTSAFRICPAKQFLVFLHSIKITDLTYCILNSLSSRKELEANIIQFSLLFFSRIYA
jgi:hypothetical protein